VKGVIMSHDSKQYSCIIRFLDDSEPLTVTYHVSRTRTGLTKRRQDDGPDDGSGSRETGPSDLQSIRPTANSPQ